MGKGGEMAGCGGREGGREKERKEMLEREEGESGGEGRRRERDGGCRGPRDEREGGNVHLYGK